MKNIVLFGPPGSGKGTQAAGIITKYKLVHLSTGDMLRAEIAGKTKLGLEAKSLMDKGELVPDAVVIGMIENQLNANPKAAGFVFDGFPRTVAQAQALDGLLAKKGNPIQKVLSLKVSEQELTKRILERGATSGRTDDQDEKIVKNRVVEYRTKTEPLAIYYAQQRKLVEIQGEGTVDHITDLLNHEIDTIVEQPNRLLAAKPSYNNGPSLFSQPVVKDEPKPAPAPKVVAKQEAKPAPAKNEAPKKEEKKAAPKKEVKKAAPKKAAKKATPKPAAKKTVKKAVKKTAPKKGAKKAAKKVAPKKAVKKAVKKVVKKAAPKKAVKKAVKKPLAKKAVKKAIKKAAPKKATKKISKNLLSNKNNKTVKKSTAKSKSPVKAVKKAVKAAPKKAVKAVKKAVKAVKKAVKKAAPKKAAVKKAVKKAAPKKAVAKKAAPKKAAKKAVAKKK